MKMQLKSLLVACLAMPLILGCSNDDGVEGCYCPEYYEPVCGENGLVYSNSCFAECDNVSYAKGVCQR